MPGPRSLCPVRLGQPRLSKGLPRFSHWGELGTAGSAGSGGGALGKFSRVFIIGRLPQGSVERT